MQVKIYWNHAPTIPDANGVAWVGSSGPAGSIAVGGGGFGSVNNSSVPFANQPPDAAIPLVATRRHATDSASWELGFAAPRGAQQGQVVGHCFVIVLEGL